VLRGTLGEQPTVVLLLASRYRFGEDGRVSEHLVEEELLHGDTALPPSFARSPTAFPDPPLLLSPLPCTWWVLGVW